MDDKWVSLVNRLVQEAEDTLRNNRSSGSAIVTVHILINSKGLPLLWVVQDGKRIEPSNAALSLIRELSEF